MFVFRALVGGGASDPRRQSGPEAVEVLAARLALRRRRRQQKEQVESGQARPSGSGRAPASEVAAADLVAGREERRAAALGLRSLAHDYPQDVGTKGMPALVGVLGATRRTGRERGDGGGDGGNVGGERGGGDEDDEDNEDEPETVRAVLETLAILFARGHGNGESDHSLAMSELFLKDTANVGLLIELLGEPEFYVRHKTLQLLATLLENAPERTKEGVFRNPESVARLMDLLDDRREVIRNEALLMLITLTTNNAEIQKIVAFESAFERLLALMLDEGGADGGIVVQDCLTLTLNLLRYNASNQNLFRESGCIQHIPALLLSHASAEDSRGPVAVPLTHAANAWPEQKVVNTVAILELLRALALPSSPNAAANQDLMHKSRVLTAIIDIAVCEHVPGPVRAQALHAVSDLVRDNKTNRTAFVEFQTGPTASDGDGGDGGRGALLAVVELSLRSDAPFGTRVGAMHCFQSVLFNNPDSQVALAAALSESHEGASEQDRLLVHSIVAAFIDWRQSAHDPYRPWIASVLLSHVLLGNSKAKDLAALARQDPRQEGGSLVQVVTDVAKAACRDSADTRVVVGVLSFLVVWLHASSVSVKGFLSDGSNVQFLVEQILQASGVDSVVQGLSAFLLAVCHEFNDDLVPAFTRSAIQTLVLSRIGADVFVGRIERLKDSRQFQKSVPETSYADWNSNGPAAVIFDSAVVELIKSSSADIVRNLCSPDRQGGMRRPASAADLSGEAIVESYKSLIGAQEKEIQRLRRQLAEAEARWDDEASNASLRADLAAAKQEAAALHTAVAERDGTLTELSAEHDDLLLCLAESDAQARRLRRRLRGLGEEVEESDDDSEDGDGSGDA